MYEKRSDDPHRLINEAEKACFVEKIRELEGVHEWSGHQVVLIIGEHRLRDILEPDGITEITSPENFIADVTYPPAELDDSVMAKRRMYAVSEGYTQGSYYRERLFVKKKDALVPHEIPSKVDEVLAYITEQTEAESGISDEALVEAAVAMNRELSAQEALGATFNTFSKERFDEAMDVMAQLTKETLVSL